LQTSWGEDLRNAQWLRTMLNMLIRSYKLKSSGANRAV
jgi:hypothetical protein